MRRRSRRTWPARRVRRAALGRAAVSAGDRVHAAFRRAAGRAGGGGARTAGRPRTRGHVLVFLPGSFEIRRAQTACAALARRHGWQVLPLYGDQSPEEQDRAVAPCAGTKIILSTNVAESSITIDGVSAVIDSGLARVASHSPWSGLPALQVARISQASANQRAGRAGRTGPGPRHPSVPAGGFRPPARAGRAADPARGSGAHRAAAAGHEPEPRFARLVGRSARRRRGSRRTSYCASSEPPAIRPGKWRAIRCTLA